MGCLDTFSNVTTCDALQQHARADTTIPKRAYDCSIFLTSGQQKACSPRKAIPAWLVLYNSLKLLGRFLACASQHFTYLG